MLSEVNELREGRWTGGGTMCRATQWNVWFRSRQPSALIFGGQASSAPLLLSFAQAWHWNWRHAAPTLGSCPWRTISLLPGLPAFAHPTPDCGGILFSGCLVFLRWLPPLLNVALCSRPNLVAQLPLSPVGPAPTLQVLVLIALRARQHIVPQCVCVNDPGSPGAAPWVCVPPRGLPGAQRTYGRVGVLPQV